MVLKQNSENQPGYNHTSRVLSMVDDNRSTYDQMYLKESEPVGMFPPPLQIAHVATQHKDIILYARS